MCSCVCFRVCVPLNIYEFHENWSSERYAVVRVIKDFFFPVISAFSYRFGQMLEHNMYKQQCI